jgi:HEAT repeat protein
MTTERREVLAILAELSTMHPEMRMGQWMTAFASMARGSTVESIYDVEDEELVPVMRRFLENRKRDAAEALAAAG